MPHKATSVSQAFELVIKNFGDITADGFDIDQVYMPGNVIGIGSTLLQHAIQQKKKVSAKALLENGADINKTNGIGTPLHFALQRGSIESVKLLLEKGARIDKPAHEIEDDKGQPVLVRPNILFQTTTPLEYAMSMLENKSVSKHAKSAAMLVVKQATSATHKTEELTSERAPLLSARG